MRTITVALILLLVTGVAGCSRQKPPAQTDSTAMGPAREVLYVDVRTPEEFASGHVSGALNIPHDRMEARWQELSAYTSKPVVLYCRSGRRSGLALDVLKKKGFTQVENGGGLEDLTRKGVPVTK